MKLILKKSVAFVVFISALLGKENFLFSGYLGAIIHECAHALAGLCLGVKPSRAVLGVSGMNLEIQRVPSIKKHMIILLSGPICSFILFGALFSLRKFGIAKAQLLEFASLSIGVINLFPIMPLDGGAVLRLILQSKLGIIYGAKIMKHISFFFTACFVFACLFLFLARMGNMFLIIFTVFVAFFPKRQKNLDLIEKRLVLSCGAGVKRKIKYFAFSSDTPLLSIASRISPSYYLVGAVFEDGRFIGELSENALMSALRSFGSGKSAGEYVKHMEKAKSFEC